VLGSYVDVPYTWRYVSLFSLKLVISPHLWLQMDTGRGFLCSGIFF
jgi:hypothetical protein